ncbi:hypothetical protein B0A48_12419 [Cryoendolithus antarcticus]|uniref:E3 ubiquitin-protein ligase listerin n=1 Tax=Cryoendolithus antarcticus TaxID=1507870 RepID=A0A1V8SS15_9PEZI|nr:hypothetical protein B0A48_12419 [Cryoendolithus antarcticus]
MSKKFKSQASSARLGNGLSGFGSTAFGSSARPSTLSYIQEPLDYSGISDANVVVTLKSLSKRDATTKGKALEDLQAHVEVAQSEPDGSLLEVWAQLYPRLSIDSSRRVRQLAHGLNGRICARSGKRVAKHLSSIAGPWLAGTYDSDRAAAKAAQEAFALVFPTAEKAQGVRRTFQQSILDYCTQAVLHESVKTLSDERAVSKDDAEATYARVVATSLALVGVLLETLPSADVARCEAAYDDLLQSSIWAYATHADGSVRRHMHRLVRQYLRSQPKAIERQLKDVSTAYLYKGLPSDQFGTSVDFMRTVEALTLACPIIWTEHYSGKKPAISRLRTCLKNGSQSGVAEFWPAVGTLIRTLPAEVLPTSFDDIADLLLAVREGVTRKEEKFNSAHSWQAYAEVTSTLSDSLPEDAQDQLVEKRVLPIVRQYLYPAQETVDWAISGARSSIVVARLIKIRHVPVVLERELENLADQLIEQVKLSQPEQSRDFEKSQREISATGERWAALMRDLGEDNIGLPDSFMVAVTSQESRVLRESLRLLTARHGKPYGAAAVVDALLRESGARLKSDLGVRETLESFATNDLAKLMHSPSQLQLIRCLYAISDSSSFRSAFAMVIDGLIDPEANSADKEKLLRGLFTRHTPKSVIPATLESRQLQTLIVSLASADDAGVVPCPVLLAELLPFDVVSPKTISSILDNLSARLAQEVGATDALKSLTYLASRSPSTMAQYLTDTSTRGSDLISGAVRLEQAQDDQIAELATKLSEKLTLSGGSNGTLDKSALIKQNLETVSESSLPMATLMSFMQQQPFDKDESWEATVQALPSLDTWDQSLNSIMTVPVPSLAILSPHGDAISLVDDGHHSKTVQLDGEGLSQAMRIAVYIINVLRSDDGRMRMISHGDLALEWLRRIITNLSITATVAEENLSIPGTNRMWASSPESDREALDFVVEARKLTQALCNAPSLRTWLLREALDSQADGTGTSNSPQAYYTSLAFGTLVSDLFEVSGNDAETVKRCEEVIRHLRKSEDIFALLSRIQGFALPLAGSQYMNRLCNELVADLTGLDPETAEPAVFRGLVTLNAVLRTQEDMAECIAKQRLIFLVKHVVAWLQGSGSEAVITETAKLLPSLLPAMKDMYGEHWTQILEALEAIWSNLQAGELTETCVPTLHATLKLLGTLRGLATEDEANEDLCDALKAHDGKIFSSLLALLVSSSQVPDHAHQPRRLVNELLARQLSKCKSKTMDDVHDLYALLGSKSRAVQGAAFELLHASIPVAQEQISIDAAIESKTASLPDELLSLILEVPSLDLMEDNDDSDLPQELQSYLSSWRLLFDHFDGSSYKVKSDYIEQLKDGAYLPGLLDMALEYLGHTRGKPVDVARFDIAIYQSGLQDKPAVDLQWLLTHLFYLSLLHLPSLTKSYYLDVRSRQTSQAVETWTAKFISPPIITTSLQAVADWSEKSVREDPEYEKMAVKVGMRSREISVSYVVDEQTMAIKIVLSEAYPLASAQVVGVSRVAVKEEKWQSWLRSCQGVITFSNGSIIDGLSAWRKNVTGALKGQTECAICYSIISGDKQLPTKRCPTCKNLFHASCLYKWFKTSNASTCPLCREAFNFN